MKKLLLVLLSALFAASFCTAQSMTPTAHQLGVGASVSSSNTTVQLFYDVTNSFMIEPQVGFAHSNNASSSGGGTATNYPDTWWNVGLGVYYVAMRMQRLAVLIGPAAQYSSEQFTASPASSYTLGDVVKHTTGMPRSISSFWA